MFDDKFWADLVVELVMSIEVSDPTILLHNPFFEFDTYSDLFIVSFRSPPLPPILASSAIFDDEFLADQVMVFVLIIKLSDQAILLKSWMKCQ